MSDTTTGTPPIDDPTLSAAPSDAPAEPPPASVAAVEEAPAASSPAAGADASDASPSSTESVQGNAAPASSPGSPEQPQVSESDPAAQPSSPSDAPAPASGAPLVDTPAAARAVLGDDAGIPPTEDVVHPVSEAEPEPPHPFDVIQTIRTKLAAYGEECLETVRPELEYLQGLCPPK